MKRTYGLPRRLVKGMGAYLIRCASHFHPVAIAVVLTACPLSAWGQGLPAFAPLNPVASSRSGVYFQPLNDQTGKGWRTGLAMDYASLIEYNQLDEADYVLDSEILRISFGAARNLGNRTFVQLGGSIGGAYSGFLDGFLDWYHGALGIRVSEREQRPQDRFLYDIRLPDGRSIQHSSNAMFLGDLSVGLGIRHTPLLQSVLIRNPADCDRTCRLRQGSSVGRSAEHAPGAGGAEAAVRGKCWGRAHPVGWSDVELSAHRIPGCQLRRCVTGSGTTRRYMRTFSTIRPTTMERVFPRWIGGSSHSTSAGF